MGAGQRRDRGTMEGDSELMKLTVQERETVLLLRAKQQPQQAQRQVQARTPRLRTAACMRRARRGEPGEAGTAAAEVCRARQPAARRVGPSIACCAVLQTMPRFMSEPVRGVNGGWQDAEGAVRLEAAGGMPRDETMLHPQVLWPAVKRACRVT